MTFPSLFLRRSCPPIRYHFQLFQPLHSHHYPQLYDTLHSYRQLCTHPVSIIRAVYTIITILTVSFSLQIVSQAIYSAREWWRHFHAQSIGDVTFSIGASSSCPPPAPNKLVPLFLLFLPPLSIPLVLYFSFQVLFFSFSFLFLFLFISFCYSQFLISFHSSLVDHFLNWRFLFNTGKYQF